MNKPRSERIAEYGGPVVGRRPAPCCWVVELEPGVWLTDGDGDPSRTLDENYAKRFYSRRWAKMALTDARAFRRKFINAKIYKPNPTGQGMTHETGKEASRGR